jgi:hypothetical protein
MGLDVLHRDTSAARRRIAGLGTGQIPCVWSSPLVAGGLAVGTHGYLRFTKDVGIVVQQFPRVCSGCSFGVMRTARLPSTFSSLSHSRSTRNIRVRWSRRFTRRFQFALSRLEKMQVLAEKLARAGV